MTHGTEKMPALPDGMEYLHIAVPMMLADLNADAVADAAASAARLAVVRRLARAAS